ncbi:hypothetical protein Tco_0730743 [Tanacetum coccineum]
MIIRLSMALGNKKSVDDAAFEVRLSHSIKHNQLGKDDIHSNQSTMGLAGTLTSDQLHFFNSRGYLLIESFSSNEEVDALRKRMNELLHGFDPSSSDPVTSGQIASTGMVALSYVQIVSGKCCLRGKIDSNGYTSTLLEERLNMGLNFILSAEVYRGPGQASKAGNDGIASPSSCNCSVITIDTLAGLFSDIYDIAGPLS